MAPNGAATLSQTSRWPVTTTRRQRANRCRAHQLQRRDGYAGYLLGAEDYLSAGRLAPQRGGVNMAAALVTTNRQNFIAGETGTSDLIIGGACNDLIFGGTGANRLDGGDGDDLMVGGADGDNFDGGSENGDPAAEALALGADTMVGLGGNDTYHVDDVLDVVVEAAGQGTDTVQTLMAALSIEGFANVENLTYTGVDADPFVGPATPAATRSPAATSPTR